ncbi:MAG: DUF563 domain-containing protein [Betaproteobacteria bacterium]|nr:DUF563 domain-containing protein [Betaproteobacteria bacterium]
MVALAVEDRLEVALGLHRQGRLAEAEAGYREVLEIAPGHVQALHLSGVVAHQTGRHLVAVDLIERAIAAVPGVADAPMHNNCGEACRALRDLDRAAHHFSRAIEIDPNLSAARLNLGLLKLEKGETGAAKDLFESTIALNEKFGKAHYYLGRLLLDDGDAPAAEYHLRRAMDINPRVAGTYYLLGRALLANGSTRMAALVLQDALTLEPGHVEARFWLAKTLFELCEETAAIALLDGVLQVVVADAGAVPGEAVQSLAPDPPRALSGRLESIRTWCERNSVVYRKLARVQWLPLPQPRALPDAESVHFRMPEPISPELFVTCVREARVLPPDSLVLSADDRLFLDRLVSFPEQYALKCGSIRHVADDGRLLLAVPSRTVDIDRPCFLLGSANETFQWLFECAARIWAMQQAGLSHLPMLVPEALGRRALEWLALLGIGEDRLIRAPGNALTRCRELHVASLLTLNYFVAPVAVQYLRREALGRLDARSGGLRRLFLSREGVSTAGMPHNGRSGKRIVNEAELMPLLLQHGFEAVRVENMPLAEQLGLFREAEVIVGGDDDAMANVFVAPHHARVGVIVPQGIYQPRHHFVSATLGQKLTYLIAQPDFNSNANLAECDLLLPEQVLKQFLEARD